MFSQLVKNSTQLSILGRFSIPVSLSQERCYSGLYPVKELSKIIEAAKDEKRAQNKIAVTGPIDIAPVTGIPPEHIKGRLVRIYKTPKNAMQSGTANVNHWEIEFDTRERWENPLMGWSSSGDPHSNVKIQFIDKESAIRYAEKNGWEWFVEPEKKGKPKVKSYGFNFSWNSRTRVSTK